MLRLSKGFSTALTVVNAHPTASGETCDRTIINLVERSTNMCDYITSHVTQQSEIHNRLAGGSGFRLLAVRG